MSDQDRISPYNIKQKDDENKEEYQLGNYQLIQYQILQTIIIWIECQTVKRIAKMIVGVKRVKNK